MAFRRRRSFGRRRFGSFRRRRGRSRFSSRRAFGPLRIGHRM